MNWNVAKIENDFKKEKNVDIIWSIIKYFLIIKGFEDRSKNINSNYVKLEEVPCLN